jgi:hypothetical protein
LSSFRKGGDLLFEAQIGGTIASEGHRVIAETTADVDIANYMQLLIGAWSPNADFANIGDD